VIPKGPNVLPAKEEITELCRGKMAGYKRPKRVYLIAPEEMARTATGKVLHRVLRERYKERCS